HEEKRRNRESRAEDGVAAAGHAFQSRVESCHDGDRSEDSGEDERRKARSEQTEERGVKVRGQRPEPVHDVAIEKLSARQRIRNDPLPTRIDDRVAPLPPRDDPEDRGGGGNCEEEDRSLQPCRNRGGSRARGFRSRGDSRRDRGTAVRGRGDAARASAAVLKLHFFYFNPAG